jgi:hypothetical protein
MRAVLSTNVATNGYDTLWAILYRGGPNPYTADSCLVTFAFLKNIVRLPTASFASAFFAPNLAYQTKLGPGMWYSSDNERRESQKC